MYKPTGMDNKNNPQNTAPSTKTAGAGDDPMSKPQWADSLRNLYDSVVDEPIPDSFKDLLEQLDEPDKKKSGKDGGDA